MRLAIPLLLLAACSRAPDYSGCRLVGTWELDRKISKALTENARTLGGDPAKIQSMLDGLSEDGLVPTYVFRSNGECVEPVLVNRNVRGMDGEWQLIGEGMNEATVVLTVGSDMKQTTRETFVFETPDRVFPARIPMYRYNRVLAK